MPDTTVAEGVPPPPPARPGLAGADLLFKAYEQDRTTIEGGNLDMVWPDELVPVDWVRTLELRIAEKSGWMVITFTPVEGYTPTVAQFQDGAAVVKESVGRLWERHQAVPMTATSAAAKVNGESIPVEQVRRAWQERQTELQQAARNELPEAVVKAEQKKLLALKRGQKKKGKDW